MAINQKQVLSLQQKLSPQQIQMINLLELPTEQLDNLLAALNEQYPDNKFVQNEVSNVDATIGKEFLLKSVVALVAACVLILLYVAYRFRKIGGLKAGSTAIVALLHDMIVVFGVLVLLRIPLNGNFIADLLTILGYSINDTVVIYDRIRENSALYSKKQMGLAELVNLSVNQSFARSLMTSITTSSTTKNGVSSASFLNSRTLYSSRFIIISVPPCTYCFGTAPDWSGFFHRPQTSPSARPL